MKNLLNTLVIFLIGTADLCAQDSYDLLKLLDLFCKPHQLISVDAVINYYKEVNQSVESDTMKVRMQMQAGNIHYVMRDHEFLLNDKYSIVIDHDRKLIFINSNDTYPAQSFSLVQVEDAVKSQEASVHSLGGTSFRRGYRAAFATLPIKSMDFWFDTKTGFLKSIEILYRNQNWAAVDYSPHITISYENYVVEKKAAISHFFMESRFVVQKSGQFVASPALIGYKVIDNTKW